MTVPAGTRLGSYEVIAPLGSGGMGEVYCARDARLDREVAIKVLPADRLADAGRRARFEREARAVAALSHPNIVIIHEIESAEGVDFIVMELVQGETLARVLRRGPLPTIEALRIAIPLADALAAAHAAGVVHRDLKPANVMLGRDRVVKVLDFGLAKLAHDDAAGSDVRTETAAEPLSRPGTVAGTAGYMSPEQVSAGDVDARSDVFSFGVLLYEMITGRRAFPGDLSTEAIAAVLKDQPKPPSELAPDVPKELERIILRCLRKEPSRRFQHMADVKVELQEVKEDSDSQATTPAAVAGRRSRQRRNVGLGLGAALLVSLLAGAAWWQTRKAPPPPRLVPLSWTGRDESPTFSPDGEEIAYASGGEKGDNWDIWLKMAGEVEARRLTTDPATDQNPSWSPDRKQIAFTRVGSPADGIYLVSPVGGSERRLTAFPTGGRLSWSADGRWLAAAGWSSEGTAPSESRGIHLIPVDGGDARAITLPKTPSVDTSPAFSPDGRSLAYASCDGDPNAPSCNVFVLPLDPAFQPRGPARRLTRQGLWILGLDWTRDGRSIVYSAASGPLWRVRADGRTPPETVEIAGVGTASPAAARGRDRLAFIRVGWISEIHRMAPDGVSLPLIRSRVHEIHPQYSPDGRRVAFASDRSGDGEIWIAEADGTNPARLTRGPNHAQGTPRWSPDGRTIVFDSRDEAGHYDVWTIGVDGSGLRQVTRDPTDENMASFSRDGRWIYFGSNRTGRADVWRVPAAGGAEEQVTREGGAVPFESADGRTLYFIRSVQNDALLGRPVAGGEERVVLPCIFSKSYAVAPRGLYYVGCSAAGGASVSRRLLRFRDLASGDDRPVGTFEAEWVGGLSAAPDGRSVLYSPGTITRELMMIENFR